MKKSSQNMLLIAVMAGLTLMGCEQRAQNAQDAIQQAQTKATVEEQAQYLVKQANMFINSDQFDEAIAAARHVLSKLDADSAEAKSIIQKAQEEMKKLASQKVEGVKDAIKGLGQ